MGIYRTNNPTEYDDLDGIIIDERSPDPRIRGVGTGTVLLVGKFQRGDNIANIVGSTAQFYEKYGKSSFDGNHALLNKRFSNLKIRRVIASDAVAATLSLQGLKFDAKSKGAWGNAVTITVEDGTMSNTKKITVKGNDAENAQYFPNEVFDNITVDNAASRFASSKLVSASRLSATVLTNAVDQSLATGSDGSIADNDYKLALEDSLVERLADIIILDEYNTVRNEYLEAHVISAQDRIAICGGPEEESVSEATTEAGMLRQVDGRIIYAYNWISTLIDGVSTFTSPTSWYASILSQTAPNVDPAYALNNRYMQGAIGVKNNSLTRANYIALLQGGVSSFENDLDIGIKVKSGVTTQIVDSTKVSVLRRRMSDYLINSIAPFMKLYQNTVNSLENRNALKAAILGFVQTQELLGILPTDAEVNGGRAKVVDVESQNTDDSIAAGLLIVNYRQRIFSSARFIVLKTEIGESVVVTEE